MTLIERYLRAVRFFLPRRQQDDIVRELSENLASEIEERTAALGRDLSDGEVADILRRHGHPAVVAGRYAPRQQLIGPVFFPIYVLTLKLGLVAALVVTVVLAMVTVISDGPSLARVMDALFAYPGRALIVFAWTTIGFAALDALGTRSQVKTDWDPRKIPDWMTGVRPAASRGRGDAALGAGLGFVALGWLLAVPSSPSFALGPLAHAIEFGPVWRTWYVPLVVVAAAQLAVDVHALVWPGPHRRRTATKLGLLGAQLVVALFIVSARVWVLPKPGAGPLGAHQAAEVVAWVNVAFGIGFAAVVVVTLIEMGTLAYRLRA